MNYLVTFIIATLTICSAWAAPTNEKPNILWIVAEDHGPHMGCYGDTFATTPNIDRLAERGMCYDFAWSCAPVCAPARTTLWSGLFGPSSGGEHMRSMAPFPEGKKMWPAYLREAGYYCTGRGKEDYNLETPPGVWDEPATRGHWNQRPEGQPFFAYFNNTESHESRIHKREGDALHDPKKVRIPAYHPDAPMMREEWARYYDSVTAVDKVAAQRLNEIAKAGLADDTIIFYFADHGAGLARNKRWPNNAGLRVPVVVYFPKKWEHLAPEEYKKGGRSDRLISFVDFGPTVLSIAGIKPPEWMQGHAFAGEFPAAPQPFVYGFRGRMDERTDLVRSVSNGRYVYLRNYNPHLSQGQHLDSQIRLRFSSTYEWRKLYDKGKLNEAQSLFWKTPKDPEELYDLETDPDEVNNLAASPDHQDVLQKLRQAQQAYARSIRDVGFIPESQRALKSMAPYDFGQDEAKYNFDRIFSTADLASNRKADAVPELKKRMKDSDETIRYWAAMGMVMRDEEAVQQSQSDLVKLLYDPSPDVQIAAGWALTQHGSPEISRQALDVLAKWAPRDKNDLYISMAALTAIDNCGMKAAPIKDQFPTWPMAGESTNKRYKSCSSKLLNQILKRFGYPAVKGVR